MTSNYPNQNSTTAETSGQQPAFPPKIPNVSSAYYVVSKTKFFTLYLISFGIYGIYWFWKNWQIWKIRNDAKIWPIARAFFNIFFTHSLFKRIQADAEKISTSKLENLQVYATGYVASQLCFNIADRLFPEDPLWPSLICIVILLVMVSCFMWKAQNQANIASLDQSGNTNSTFTPANYIIIVLGAIFWLIILLIIIAELAGF